MYVKQVVDNGATVIVDDSNSKNDHVVRYNLRVATSTIAGYIYGGPAVDSRNTTTGSPGGGAAVSPGSQLISVSWRGPAKLAHDLLGHRRPSVEWAADDRRRWHDLLQASRRDQPHFRLDQCLRAGPGSHATDLLDDSGQPVERAAHHRRGRYDLLRSGRGHQPHDWPDQRVCAGSRQQLEHVLGDCRAAVERAADHRRGRYDLLRSGRGHQPHDWPDQRVCAGSRQQLEHVLGDCRAAVERAADHRRGRTTYSLRPRSSTPAASSSARSRRVPAQLSTYWVTAGQPWNGPQTIGGAGTTYSAPAAASTPAASSSARSRRVPATA